MFAYREKYVANVFFHFFVSFYESLNKDEELLFLSFLCKETFVFELEITDNREKSVSRILEHGSVIKFKL